MQWLQGCRGTATPQMGILSRNIDSILGSFSAISTAYLGPTVNIMVREAELDYFKENCPDPFPLLVG